ncbi:MAG: hypothetical protein ACOCXA_03465 [Planctomycetota bacterium]
MANVGPAMLSRFHAPIYLQAWAARSAAGDAAATWQACIEQRCCLRHEPDGWWYGSIGSSPWQGGQDELLMPLLSACLPAEASPPPGLLIGSSKGDPGVSGSGPA